MRRRRDEQVGRLEVHVQLNVKYMYMCCQRREVGRQFTYYVLALTCV